MRMAGPLGGHLALLAGTLAAMALAVAAETGFAAIRGTSPSQTLAAIRNSSGGTAVADAIGPIFRQSGPERCGAAALAFALTHMGELALEEDLVAECELSEGLVSFGDLARCARRWGYRTRAVEADWAFARATAAQGPVILHLSHQHFVVALQLTDDEAWIFDPALGSVRTFKQDNVLTHWTGAALALTYPSAAELDGL